MPYLPQVIFVTMFLFVFSCAFGALAQMPVFNRASRTVVAACVALLSALGLLQQFRGGIEEFRVLLLPYAALGAALFVLLLLAVLLGVGRWLRRKKKH